jgi:hypothetical protein
MYDVAVAAHQGRSSHLTIMMPRTSQEVARLICDRRWKRKHILSFKQVFGERALFDALFIPFVTRGDSADSYGDQQIAGSFLLEFLPECTLSLADAIRGSLSNWNLSVEELPFYFCRKFGYDAVAATIESISIDDSLDDVERDAVRTLQYWMRAPKTAILGQASQE